MHGQQHYCQCLVCDTAANQWTAWDAAHGEGKAMATLLTAFPAGYKL